MKHVHIVLPLASLLLWLASAAQAQGLGVASVGATGGLHIPSAYVLGTGEMAASLGSEQDPKLGTFSRRRNYTLGFGLGGGVELFGRLAEYQNPRPTAPGLPDVRGPRDLSGNVKWQLPTEGLGLPLPRLAVGLTDVSGSDTATYFRSAYAVASDDWGPLRWSLGYAHSKARGQARVLDGLFGGAEMRLWDTRATALLETDGTRRHAGLRYYSEPLPWLGDAQLIGSVQRSFGATSTLGRPADANSFNLTLVLPLETDDATRDRRALAAAKAQAALPPLAPVAGAVAAAPLTDPLPALQASLRSAGLDRVRVGTLGDNLVVEYENHRYLQNEVDALGVVLGLAAEQAPSGVHRVHAITLKAGQVVFETSVNLAAFRIYLREGDAAAVQASMGFGRLPGYESESVQWLQAKASSATRVRVAFSPLLNHATATEFGLFDYSLAVQARTSANLWRGGVLYADLVQRVANSDNMEPGRIYAGSRHRNGLQTLALQQSFWLGERVFASVGAGRYQHDRVGAEGEAIFFVPGRDDTAHLRASVNRRTADAALHTTLPRTVDAVSALYRWRLSSTTWAEGGVHRYTDGSSGPALGFTRWFGDVALQLYARRGGNNTFVGLELSLPIAPRQGMGAAPVQFTGSPRFAPGIRSLMASGSNSLNFVKPDAVRPVDLAYEPEVEMLNSGRVTPDYMRSQLPRLRESFYLHALPLMP